MPIYSGPNYAMGDVAPSSITPAEKSQAESAIRGMKRSLKGWLKYRTTLQGVVTGAIPAKKLPASTVAVMFANRDTALEQRMANSLHALLSEMFDPSSLPEPDLTKNPDGAAQLAAIAVAGKLPAETTTPAAQGFSWLWPTVIVIGLVLFTLVVKIQSDASVAEAQLQTQCIQSGQCTDYGFWLKVGGITLAAWLIWDKFGGREAAGSFRKKASS